MGFSSGYQSGLVKKIDEAERFEPRQVFFCRDVIITIRCHYLKTNVIIMSTN